MPRSNVATPLSPIDQQPVGLCQIYVFALCGLALLLDGFDVQSIGYVAPRIIQEWKVAPAQLGPVFSAGFVGLALGAMALTYLADRYGRRPTFILSLAIAGLGMLATAATRSMDQLLIIRLLTGVGLGGLMPNIVALTSEYTPTRFRAAAVIVMAALFSAGAAVGGVGAKLILDAFDWPVLFLIGGGSALAVALVVAASLPESLEFLTIKGVAWDQRAKLLRRLFPTADLAPYALQPPRTEIVKAPVAHLFKEGRAAGTALIWVVIFMNLMELYSLSNWLPTVMKISGLSLDTAVQASTLLQVGGVVGSIVFASILRWIRLSGILLGCFTLGAASIAAIGWLIDTRSGAMMAVVTTAGFCVVGGQSAINALAAAYYPTQIRASGVGWALGVGRIGSILGPLLGGLMIALKWRSTSLFVAAAVPSAIAAVAMVLFIALERRSGGGAPAGLRNRQIGQPDESAGQPV